jgi:tetratricopeptide (TPR) repeat protein
MLQTGHIGWKYRNNSKRKNTTTMAGTKRDSRKRPPPLAADTLAKFLKRATQLHGEGRFDEAARHYEHIQACNLDVLAAPYFLALMDLETGFLERALEGLRLVTRKDPGSFDAVFALAHTFEALGQWQQAADVYRRAWATRPWSTAARFSLAHALEILGKVDEAISLCRALAELPPMRLRALIGIARLKASAITPAENAELAAAAWDGETPVGTRIAVLFAVGETLEASRQYEAAFAAFLEANRLRREHLIETVDETPALEIASPGSRAKANHPEEVARGHAEFIARAKSIFTPPFLQRHSGKGHASAAPIFILGMPRSGSTLIEQILSSHGKVTGLGEGPAVWRTIAGRFPLVADPAANDDPEYFRTLAESYLALQRAAGWGKSPFLVDKMLGNYINIGMIHLMFPNATIVHSVRDPVDTCLGCFRQLFRSGNETTYDLRDVGAQYVRYREMMAHWDALLPGRVTDVVHEDLVTDPDRQIRWLIEDACKLKWDDNCLRFHQTKRAVRTASVAQVRQPIFSSSLQRWRKYADHLGPLFEALGPYAPR